MLYETWICRYRSVHWCLTDVLTIALFCEYCVHYIQYNKLTFVISRFYSIHN